MLNNYKILPVNNLLTRKYLETQVLTKNNPLKIDHVIFMGNYFKNGVHPSAKDVKEFKDNTDEFKFYIDNLKYASELAKLAKEGKISYKVDMLMGYFDFSILYSNQIIKDTFFKGISEELMNEARTLLFDLYEDGILQFGVQFIDKSKKDEKDKTQIFVASWCDKERYEKIHNYFKKYVGDEIIPPLNVELKDKRTIQILLASSDYESKPAASIVTNTRYATDKGGFNNEGELNVTLIEKSWTALVITLNIPKEVPEKEDTGTDFNKPTGFRSLFDHNSPITTTTHDSGDVIPFYTISGGSTGGTIPSDLEMQDEPLPNMLGDIDSEKIERNRDEYYNITQEVLLGERDSTFPNPIFNENVPPEINAESGWVHRTYNLENVEPQYYEFVQRYFNYLIYSMFDYDFREYCTAIGYFKLSNAVMTGMLTEDIMVFVTELVTKVDSYVAERHLHYRKLKEEQENQVDRNDEDGLEGEV